MRQWGLQLVYIFSEYLRGLKPHPRRTRGRIAIFRDRYTAVLATASSIPAMAGPILLSFFITKDTYIGGELSGPSGYDKEKFLALQFTAKLLELLIIWSLNSMIFTLVHHEKFLGEGVPLASFVAGFEFTSISFLVSKNFCAILKGSCSAIWKTVAFVAVIVICSILAVTAAPATASAINPLYQWWFAGGTDVWFNNTEAQMFPGTLNDTDTLGSVCEIAGDEACPSARWQSMKDQLVAFLPKSSHVVDGVLGPRLPQRVSVTGKNSALAINIRMREPIWDIFSPNFSVASAPHSAIADALILTHVHWDQATRNSTEHGQYRFYYRSDERANLLGPAAITHTRCRMSTRSSDTFDPGPPFPDFHYDSFPEVNITNKDIKDWMLETLPRISRPQLLWFEPDPEMASLGALVAVPTESSSTIQLFGCFIDARWVNTTLTSDRLLLTAEGEPPRFRSENLDGTDPSYGWRANIQRSFAQYLNPRVPTTNGTVFQEMASSGGLRVPGLTGSGSEPHLETILTLMVVNGMARTAPYTTSLALLVDAGGEWWQNFMPQNQQTFGPGGNAYAVTPEQQATFYRLQMKAYVQGYAYTRSNSAVQLALVVLHLYVTIVVIYIVLTGVSGLTSSSWDTPSELLALALRSTPPSREKLPDVSAGFSKLQPLREK